MIPLILMVLALGVMITIHELGHFLAARAFGVGIEKFSIGFGAPIVEFEKKGIKYRIAWIPLGGYVKMKGEDPEDEDPEDVDPEELFSNKAWWKRAIIAFSGPFANLLLGLLLFIIALMLPQKMEDLSPVIFSAEGIWSEHFMPGDSLISVNGEETAGFNQFLISLYEAKDASISYQRGDEKLSLQVSAAQKDSLMRSLRPQVLTRIGEVIPGMSAWRAGLKSGDIVLEVDSVAVSNWYDMRSRIISSPQGKVHLLLKRDGETFSRQINLEENIASEQGKMIGISKYLPVSQIISYGPLEAVKLGALSTVNFISLNYKGIYQLVKRPSQIKSSIGGPVLMASMSAEMGKKGASTMIFFFGSISLILMVMNLLPIPILDGGHIMFSFIEGIAGRPVPLRVQAIAQRIGFMLLIALMLLAFYSDISKLVYRFMYTR
ncbi:MAG: RIP metalloprotease RseP [Candidatus Cloacimonetes bacterium]|jgi:regulator of sigma E protease|nr:RIP metalloprotease RseP [Candidatus Cloacimonadota bacterium]MCB5287970.1 RIP metalloprotease RseP [Candidatus Cloacimonadota bacterium]MCK9184995.1 RIP metalloprotease RseP [Candidatus Cloacimonadota bacterium]MCK9585171.1 RIP metalloprotease RseP [Candidatus Cloacimonadota bacterium]MDY0230291.1 RIP metalloprotease RseP [Candidatus Cloacimonadaceae bacterium]